MRQPSRAVQLRATLGSILIGLSIVVSSCSASPIETAVPITEAAASPTAQPTATATATPTEIPDPMLQAAESLGADWGSLEKVGDQWLYNSPDSVIVGKDVEVTLGTFNIDGVDRSAILVDGEWPIAIQNEDWQGTPIKYGDVTIPLVDAQGNPIPLTCKLGSLGIYKRVDCFLIKSSESFIENGVEYTQVELSLNESGLKFAFLVPQELEGILGQPSLLVYPNRVYRIGEMGLRGVGNGFRFSQLALGEEFFFQGLYDAEDLEAHLEKFKSEGNQSAVGIIERMLNFREQAFNMASIP